MAELSSIDVRPHAVRDVLVGGRLHHVRHLVIDRWTNAA
jgi:hypothetical protein